MAPESEEKQVPQAPAGGEPVIGDLGPPTGTPTDTVVPSCSQNTKTHSPRLASGHLQLAPEALDPRTLRLLWGQRELEIRALRWAIRNGPHARHCHILQEVSGLPSERSFHSPDKFLQDEVEKLTLELKAQKEQAQQEKEHLEEQLMQTVSMLQQLEAQLQAFQKSCLLQLACSSWVGRVLRSQTGSVEVVTAETLMDSSDFSESEQAPAAGEGIRLEDVDWNSIAHRYPNLFTDSSSRHKQPQQSPSLEKGGSDSPVKHMEKQSRSLEWSSLPRVGTSSSGGAGSDSSSCQLALRSGVQKAAEHPPQAEGLTSSEQIPTRAWSFSRDSEDLKTHSQPLSKPAWEPCTAPDHRRVSLQLSPAGCCLKIATVSRREKFIRVLNQSLEQTVDLTGFVLQQLAGDFPVCLYRFPPGTLLAPQHHITVWGEGPRRTTKQPPLSLGQDAFQFHCSLGRTTLLLNPEGQVLSEHQTPHRVTSGSRIFTDNTDWSIDRFPLSKSQPSADTSESQRRPRPPRKGRVRNTRARRQRPGMRDILPLLRTCQPFHLPEVPVRPENTQAKTLELLPAIPEAGLCPEDGPTRKEHKVQVCRKNVDRSCPMVTLSVQSTAESRYGFRFLSCPPITVDTGRRV
ncbi:lamin tail domain-containing protein 2 isoform X1 [Sciurus carolinensis]|uniref:lamin tail domain-containing protein 2 isoform X1 n=1 Tax=Sciurus carolinensis TaxID=30640 RepID=UPI001FB49D2F|nr:lamin tail domain-containing protein 2 isoform X1 [Sciurus carolinensis]XP_047372776.1 lamin tail domain-containing protein 2 isoform X1 [Sciurus carolinensis]XP_047372777.1 lamin tail domain-containing protein 2 isoform X1 [Sciurus carolinensis]